MNLAQRIQAKTDNGDLIIDFLIEVMTGDARGDFKLFHQLQAARLLTSHGCSCLRSAVEGKPAVAERDQAIDFILHNLPEPSRHSTDSSSPDDSEFDRALAKKIQESTDDGATVCRFLINVMEGQLKTFKPHHRITAARELLTRGFDKHAASRRSGEEPVPYSIRDRNPEEAGRSGGENQQPQPTPSLPAHLPPVGAGLKPAPTRSTQPTKSEKSPNPINQSSDNSTPDDEDEIPWDQINKIIDDAIEESDRIMAEQEIDPANPPYTRDLSAFDQAWENSRKWFEEWKNSIDPEEYEAIINEKAAAFDTKLETRLERRKQIAEERERREKEEPERQSAVVEETHQAESTPEYEPGPPTRSKHRRKLMFTLGNSMYIECGHPDCRLHDEDRGRFRGSVQYGAGPNSGHFP